MKAVAFSRRALLKGGLAVGAGLVVGFAPPRPRGARGAGKAFAPNQWLTIDGDGLVTIINSVPEMGQGTSTSMAMIVADELDVDLSKVHLEQAPADPSRYANPVTGSQSFGGSRGVRDHITTWRRAAAAARQMLKEAAARQWGVPLESVETKDGVVYHRPSGRSLTYGQLADKASELAVPQNPTLKTPDQFRYIGKDVKRLDSPSKLDGRATFGIDVKVPGMLVASVERCPVFGGKVASFDAGAAERIAGVRKVVQIGSGVAVVADTYWAARKGRDALKVTWDEGALAHVSTGDITRAYQEAVKRRGLVARGVGDAEKALAAGGKVVEATYEVPFLAHATMEPQNCTAHVTADACVVWAPTQAPGPTQETAASLTGLPLAKVTVHTTFLGGGFGRRGRTDFVVDAVETSKAVGAPVKVIWSREEDMQHDFYRPATYNVFRAALDERGLPSAWHHRIAGPAIQYGRGRGAPGTVNPSSVEVAANHPYDVPNVLVEWIETDLGVPVGAWRSVGASQNGFLVESFIDELAHAARKDPFEYRRALLGKSPRHKRVLEVVADRAGWGTPPAPGRHRGIAVVASFGSYVAQVAEVSVAPDGKVRIHRVVCALDCGLAVNPDQVRAQMEGGIVFGLTAALYGEITIDRGRAKQRNFDDYKLMRIGEAPLIEVHIVPGEEATGGSGEPGVPPAAPALCNAIFAATGKRVRRLPIRPEELRRA